MDRERPLAVARNVLRCTAALALAAILALGVVSCGGDEDGGGGAGAGGEGGSGNEAGVAGSQAGGTAGAGGSVTGGSAGTGGSTPPSGGGGGSSGVPDAGGGAAGVLGSAGSGGGGGASVPDDAGGADGDAATSDCTDATAMAWIVDASGSTSSVWPQVLSEMTAYLGGSDASQRPLIGAQAFPEAGAQCTGIGYDMFEAPIGSALTTVATYLNGIVPGGNADLEGALKGVGSEADDYATANPTHRIAHVLFIDVPPTACETDTALLAGVVATQRSVSGRRTYVIALNAVDQIFAHQLAAAGDTGTAYDGSTSGGVVAALEAIEADMATCP